MNTQGLDIALMSRYLECSLSHPRCTLTTPARPITNFDLDEILAGHRVHVMVARGARLTVQWIPANGETQFLFDAYGS